MAVVDGVGSVHDWVGLFDVGETDLNQHYAWQYANGTAAPGPATTATLTFTMPIGAGSYEFQLINDDGIVPATVLATSNTVTVEAEPSSVLPTDTFTSATAVNLESHIPDSGTSWEIARTVGAAVSLGVTAAGTLKSPIDNAGTRGVLYVVSPELTDPIYTVSVEIVSPGDAAGFQSFVLVGHYIDSNNYYYMVVFPISGAGDWLEVRTRIAGIDTTVKYYNSNVVGVAGTVYGLEFTATDFRGLRNGVPVTNMTDILDSALLVAGKAGVGMGAIDGYGSYLDQDLVLDNFEVTGDTGIPAPITAADTRNLAASETTANVGVLDNDTNVATGVVTIPVAATGATALVAGDNRTVNVTRIGTAAGSYSLNYVVTTSGGSDTGTLSGTIAAYVAPVGGSLEPTNGSAEQVTISVAQTPRQAWYGFGFGLADPGGSQLIHPYMVQYADRLFDELGTTVLRLNTPALRYKPSVVFGLSRGVDMIICTGYIAAWRNSATGVTGHPANDYSQPTYAPGVYSPTLFADDVKYAIDNGIPITHVCIQNEPDGNPDNLLNPADPDDLTLVVSWNQELRARLNAIGLSTVKIFGLEWAHFGSNNIIGGLNEYDVLDAAGLIPGTVMAGGGHCYGDCPTLSIWDNRWMTKMGASGQGLFSPETGSSGNPNRGARFLAGLNHGVSVECQHYSVTVAAGSEPFQQALIGTDGVRRPWHAQCRIIANTLIRDSRFRLCTSSDRPPGLSVGNATYMLRNFSSYNPRIQASVAKRPDNQWAIMACNATEGTVDEVTVFLNAHYKSALIQLTVNMPELAGQNLTFAAQRCNVGGTISTQTVNMVDGVARFTMPAGDTIAMVSN